MGQPAVVGNVTQAMRMIKSLDLREEWYDDYRTAGRQAVRDILELKMENKIDNYLEEIELKDIEDRRNGSFSRHLLTEIGDIEIDIPRTRHFSAVGVIKAYSRRGKHIDRMIMGCFLLGLSTRKVAKALFPILGEQISATTVSRISKCLDSSVKSFHRRRLRDQYRVLVLDGVVLSRKTGAGAIKRPVLVALGIRPDGRKEIIDFRLSKSESTAEWIRFLNNLYRRGIKGDFLELICIDGSKGLSSALSEVYPMIPYQRCFAHKTRNITDKVKKKDREKVKRDLHKISYAENRRSARHAARRFANRWEEQYPRAVRCLKTDLDDLLMFFIFETDKWRKMTRTTNAIERRFREVRRRTRPMGVLSDRTSMDRILFAVFTYENQSQGVCAPFLVTQNN